MQHWLQKNRKGAKSKAWRPFGSVEVLVLINGAESSLLESYVAQAEQRGWLLCAEAIRQSYETQYGLRHGGSNP